MVSVVASVFGNVKCCTKLHTILSVKTLNNWTSLKNLFMDWYRNQVLHLSIGFSIKKRFYYRRYSFELKVSLAWGLLLCNPFRRSVILLRYTVLSSNILSQGWRPTRSLEYIVYVLKAYKFRYKAEKLYFCIKWFLNGP